MCHFVEPVNNWMNWCDTEVFPDGVFQYQTNT